MEDVIWIIIFIFGIIWRFLSKAGKAPKPIGPAPSPSDEDEVEFEEVPSLHLDELPPPKYFEEEPLETSPVLFVERVKPEPVVQKPARVVPPPLRRRRRARRRIPNLKEAVVWSEILAPPVALRTDEPR